MIFVSSTFVKHCFTDSATGATDAQFARDCFLSNNSVLILAKFFLFPKEGIRKT